MNSNDKTKPVGKKAKKEPTIEDLLLEDDTSDSKVTNTSVLHKLKDVKEKTKKSASKKEVETKIDEIVEEKELSKKELKKQKKEEKKKNRRKFRNGEKLFILLNVIIIFYIMGFYAYRAYYYHKKLNLDVLKTMSLKEVATNIKNISFSGDGLYEDDENKIYYYKGKDVKNYVYFQGRIWQMLTIGDYIKMIQVDNVASIVAGINMDYNSSYLHTWLDDYSKTFKDSENYLEETKWCSKEVDVKDYKCEEFIEGSIGLLTIEDYLKAGADSSFINSSEYFWTMNYNDKKEFYYVNGKGQINNNVNEKQNYFSFGLRPVITIKSSVIYKSGSGTIDDPYQIGDVVNAALKDNYVGSYVKYKDFTFRIINADDSGTEMILDSIIDEKVTFNNYLNFLNNYFVSKLNANDLVNMNFNTNIYNYGNKFNYKNALGGSTKSSKVRIPNIGDYFTVNYSDYWLNNIFDTNLKLYSVIMDNNTYFSDLAANAYVLRPIIKIEPNMVIESGNGLRNDPIVIGEVNETKEKEY